MAALSPWADPLIAEAKLRMRRRRTVLAGLGLVGAAVVLFFTLRPSGAPRAPMKTHGGNGNRTTLAHLNVPMDAAERKWLAGIESADWGCACGLTAKGVGQVRRRIVSAAHVSGATIVRMRVFGYPGGTVEVVLVTRMNPAEARHRLRPLVRLLRRGYSYAKLVNGRGAQLFEWHWLPRPRAVGPV